ncbi:MAG: restriction endonuclease [Candidatus Peribacteria bacterium]|nr:restriction endonuclease [Candidatus Peribacteria bacterium]
MDIRARKKLQILLIQCKHWWGNRQVGVKEIREFQGAISLYNKEFKNDGKGIFITTGRSTEYAKEEAKKL